MKAFFLFLVIALLASCQKLKPAEIAAELSVLGKSRALPCEGGFVYKIDYFGLKFPSVDPSSNPDLFAEQQQKAQDFFSLLINEGLVVGGSLSVHQIDVSGTWHATIFCTHLEEKEVKNIFNAVLDSYR